MKYESAKRVVSKVDESVTFILKKMNVFRRDQLEELKRPFERELRPLREQLEPLTAAYRAAYDEAKALVQPARDEMVAAGSTKEEAEKSVPIGKLDFPDEQFQQWLDLTQQVQKIDRAQLTPAAVKFVLVRIEGLEIDDQPGTFESLLENGTDELYNELALEVARELGLLPEEAQNLPSPSISVVVEDGLKTIGSVAPVEKQETTILAAA